MHYSDIIPHSQDLPVKNKISHSTLIQADPSRIFHALTTSQGLDSWFTSGSRVNAIAGGEIYFRWENWGPGKITIEDDGLVLEAIPSERFVFQWHPDLPDYSTTVEIDIKPTENGTIVSLHEYGFAETPSGHSAMISCATGWGEALTLLKFYLEHGLHY